MAVSALVRAAMAFLLVFALGFVVQAATASDPVAHPAPLAFGDRAVYNITVRDLDTGRSQPFEPSRLMVEVGPEATIAGADGSPVLATPLLFQFEIPTLNGPGYLVRSYWFAGDHAVASITAGAGSASRDGTNLGVSPATGAQQSLTWRETEWSDISVPCGFDLTQPRAAMVACGAKYDAAVAWPSHILAAMPAFLGPVGPGHTAHELVLVESGQALSPWPPASGPAALPKPLPLPRLASGPQGTDPSTFRLADALMAMQTSTTDTAASDLQARSPNAYLAYARSYTANDLTGGRQEAWHLILVGDDEQVERIVTREASPFPILPPTTSVLTVNEAEFALDAPPSVRPPPNLAPTNLPGLDSLQAAFAIAAGRSATGWSFAVSCPSRSCFDIEARIDVLAEDLAPAQPGASRWQRHLAVQDRLTVDGQGQYLHYNHAEFGQPVPDLLAVGPLAPADQPTREARAFPFPSAPEAAAIGAASLLAALAAASWPFLKVYLPLFSRIEANRLLDHPVRRRIHDLVHEEPGIHSREIATRLDLAGNTAQHHLDRLVGAGFLGDRRIAGYRCYFVRGGLDERLQDAIPMLKSKGAQAVLLAVDDQGAPSFKSLMTATSLGYATVHHHANRLWRAGLLSSERDGKARRFKLTELGRRVAQQAKASLEKFPTHPKKASPLDGAS